MSISSKIQSLITAANSVTGESRTDLTSAVQDLKDGYGGGGGLPAEYQEVEYIESSGTQYIQLDFKLTSTSQIYMIAEASAWSVSSGGKGICGARTSTTNKVFQLIAIVGKLRYDYGTNSPNYYDFTLSSGKHTFNMNGEDLWVDGTRLNRATRQYYQTDYNACVFSANQGGTPNDKFPMKLYELKIATDGIPVGNYVPCYRKSDNEIGLYDTISETFYTNAGTGSFTCYPAPPTI